MPYKLHEFDSLAIPTRLGSSGYHEISSGEASSPLLELPGGNVFDPWGTGQAPHKPTRLTASVILVEASAAAVKTTYDTWLAKVGKRGTLIRLGEDAGATHQSCTARLLNVQCQRRYDYRSWLPVTLEFETLTWPWTGAAIDSTVTLDAAHQAPNTNTIANAGNATVSDVTITITVPNGGTPITTASVILGSPTLAHWHFTGTIAANTSLIIDTGSRSVLNNGANAYASFALQSDHTYSDWFRLAAGNNTLIVTLTGGGVNSTIRIQANDGWA